MHLISLGYNCKTSLRCVEAGRPTKANGYKTCPFDLCIAPYEGVVQCLRDKFRFFLDPEFIRLQTVPAAVLASAADEELIYNTKYNFVFLHESPGHANLYQTEQWSGGKYHFVDNDFAAFRERYARRIQSFHEYLASGGLIRFVIGCPHTDLSELRSAIQSSYPTLRYEIHRIGVDVARYRESDAYSTFRA